MFRNFLISTKTALIKPTLHNRNISVLSKVWSGQQGQAKQYKEKDLLNALKAKFPNATNIKVKDVSGGCGAMFEIYVESKDFQGLSIVNQHRMITDTLKKEIKDMHGFRIQTSVPENAKRTVK